MSFRRFVSVILSYALVNSGCGYQKPKDNSYHFSKISDQERLPGPLKTEAEISDAIKALSLHTERWLTCKDPNNLAGCVELDFSDKTMTLEERQRLKLKNLLIAKKNAGYERNGVQLGIWIDEIEKDIKLLQENLKDNINELNYKFFEAKIGKNPFDIQKKYFLSHDFFTYLARLNADQRREEIEKNFILFKMIDPQFYDNKDLVKEMMLEYIYSVGLIEIDWHHMGEQQNQIINRYFAGIIANYQNQVDLILARLVPSYDRKNRETLVRSNEMTQKLSDSERKVFELWNNLGQTNADALSQVFIDLMKRIPNESSDLLSSEDFFNDRIKLAIDQSDDSMTTESIFIAGQVKFAMSAFFLFDMFGLLRIVYIGIGLAQFFNSILIDYYDPLIFLGVGSGLIWTFKAIYGLVELYGGIDFLKQKMNAIWPKTKASPIGISLDVFKNFSKNYLLAGNTTLINFFDKIGNIIFRVATLLNIALLVSLVYGLVSLSNTFTNLNTVQKILSLIGTSIVVTWLSVGITSVFLTIPGANVFWIVSTIVCFVIYLLVALFRGPPKDVRPDDNDPSVRFYKDQIDPEKSYWVWCEENDNALNCQQRFQPGILIGKNNAYEPLLMTRELGGPGGKKQLVFHYFDSQMASFKPLTMLGVMRISKVELYNCNTGTNNHSIGLLFEVKSKYIAPQDSQFKMGCTNEDDVKSRQTLDIDENDALASVKIYQPVKNIPSRRIVGLDLCTKSGKCIETMKMPEIFYGRWAQYTNDLSYQEAEKSYSAVGEIIGFHGRYGDTIDSIGVYFKAPAPSYYKREFFDDSLPWYHLNVPGDFCYQAGGDGHLIKHQKRFQDKVDNLEIQKGRCPCQKFIHTFFERGWQGVCLPSM